MLMQAGQHGAFVVRFCGLSTLIALVRRLQQIVGQVHGTAFCGGGLVSRKGRKAAPEFQLLSLYCRGCFAALSRHKAAPTGIAPAFRN
ncbi:hypothetical protein CQW32_10665 [Pseudomonas putida]|nr:hypothetical protein CQW32_10665 [Pseudomonas putida]